MKIPIYLDYAATTPVDKRVAEKMMHYLTIDGNFGNPSSKSHFYGLQAEEAVNIARYQVAKLINAKPYEIIFTSGATESNNLAIKGTAKFYQNQGKHIITSQTEHTSILESCKKLENEGFRVTYLAPNKDGIIDLDLLQNTLTDDTILVSIMHVNNEIGIIQDIFKIGEICRKHKVIFHVDAAQSLGKLPIDLNLLPIDQMSFSAHKIYGPKGIGVLYLRSNPPVYLLSQIHGGNHERGVRAGTLPLHQIVGMGEACKIAKKEFDSHFTHLNKLRNYFLNSMKNLKDIHFHGNLDQSISNILNISFNDIDGELLLNLLKDLALSQRSACVSSAAKSSYVLKSLGIKKHLIDSAIRFSFGKFTTLEEIQYAVSLIYKTVRKLHICSAKNNQY